MKCFKNVKFKKNKNGTSIGSVIENLENSSFIRLVQKETQVKDDERVIKIMLHTSQDRGVHDRHPWR